MTFDEAMAFVREHGIVLTAAQGPVPRLTEAIAGEPIKGSWWAHPKSHQIFALLQKLEASPDILVCRFVNGKVTMIHRRLWPALVKLSDRIDPGRLAQVRQEHTAKGHHETHDVPYPSWVPADVFAEARRLGDEEATRMLGPLAPR
ncbi:hypothetical protein [Dyella psychrodurans]|uniref:Uncharacterized protein n=1 Tax=Dyella psychrodurans TaxID=1927960 RepID=A0A370XC59_9GAMM|nr:hypothetical protein [Dyella psychrodurans]RDS85795.1 hypothetical protein DWU99_00525 [Dyella psychrodurans]